MKKIKKRDLLSFFNTNFQFEILRRKYKSLMNESEKNRIFPQGLENEPTAYLMITPTFQNIGDHAIVSAEIQFLKKHFKGNIVEITLIDLLKYYDDIKQYIGKGALICIQGGGNMGTEYLEAEIIRRKIIIDFPENKKIIFPQTLHYAKSLFSYISKIKSKKVYNNAKNLVICAREDKSYDDMRGIYPSARVLFVPDIVLKAEFEYQKPSCRENNIVLCLRNDPESILSKENKDSFAEMLKKTKQKIIITDMVAGDNILQEKRDEIINRQLQLFAKNSLVITDRIHGMIFAALTATPCVVISNYNHKVKGEWDIISRKVNYIKFVNDYSVLEEIIFELLNNQCKVEQLPYKFDVNDFEPLIKEVLV